MSKLKTVMTGVSLLAGSGLIITSFQNCGSTGFEAINEVEKMELISSRSVFGNNFTLVSNNTQNGDNVSTVISVNNDNTGVDIPVKFFCSTNAYKNTKRLSEVTSAFVEVRDKSSNVVCDDKHNQYSDIVDFKKIKVFNSCLSRLTAGEKYQVRVYEPSNPTLSIGKSDTNFGASTFNPNMTFDGKKLAPDNSQFHIFYDFNPQITKTVTHNDCDTKASPLVVLMGKGSERIELTSPTRGILFDILGKRAKPSPHTKKRISWFLNNNHNYYFVALPNSRGEILGIDQLFGDNTAGPDGKFADHGYAALGKYDSNTDGYITEKDPVFHKLRLWHDSNLDGKSSPDELFTLEEMNVISIDLKFDSSYKETDYFGNEILMKSAIKTRNGELHLMFDLWFRNFQ